MRARLGIAVLLSLCLLAAACGSTVQLEEGVAQDGAVAPGVLGSEGTDVAFDDGMDEGLALPEGGDGEDPAGASDGSAPGTAAPGSATTGGGGSDGTASGTDATSPNGGGGGGGSGGSGGNTGGGSARAPAPRSGAAKGLSASTIKLGFEYVGDATEANSAIGANVSSGDQRANFKALVDHYNKTGGIAGRKIEPVYYEYTSARNIDEQQSTSCATFTQDDPVFAVFVLLPETAYLNCLSKGGVGTWGYPALAGTDDRGFRAFPNYVQPSALSLSAVARLNAPGLKQAGFFKPEAVDGSTTLGLVTFDDPRYRRAVKQEFKPALARIGEKLDEEVYVKYAKSTNDVGALSAEMSNAILRFRERGVDHVTFIEYNALIAFTFLNAAERQRYRPQYGFNSTSGGQLLIDSGLAPEEQLQNSRLVGWQPAFDVPAKYTKPWKAQQECLEIYKRAGVQFPDDNSRGIGILYCTGFSFLRAALAAAPGGLSPASIPQGAERLGSDWVSPWSKVVKFAPDRHYGPARYLTAAHESDCNCFVPTGKLRPIPD